MSSRPGTTRSDMNLTTNDKLREKLAATFTEADPDRSEAYDRVRPPYPMPAVRAMAAFLGATEGPKVLEVGCGTGIATAQIARLGFDVTALDPSQSYLNIARRKLAGRGNVRFVTGKLERATFEPATFDLVVAAQSIHWVRPEDRWAGTHRVIKSGGVLALMSNFPVTSSPDDNSRREAMVDELYRTMCPSFPNEWGSLDRITGELAASSLFSAPRTTTFLHRTNLTRGDYLTWQESLSWVAADRKSVV